MEFLSKSLQRKILLLILLVGVFPALVTVISIYWGNQIALDSTVGGYLKDRANLLTRNIDLLVENKMHEFLQLKSSPEMTFLVEQLSDKTRPVPGSDEENTVLLNLLTQNSSLRDDVIAITDVRGEKLATSDLADLNYFGDEAWWETSVDLHEDSAYFAETLDFVEGKPLLVLAGPIFSSPETRDYPVAMLVCVVNTQKFFQPLSALRSGESGTVALLSSYGYFLYNPIRKEGLFEAVNEELPTIRSSVEGWFPSYKIENRKHIVAYSAVKSLGQLAKERKTNMEWHAFVNLDVGDVWAFLKLILWRTALLGFGVVAALCIAAFYFSNRIVEPLKILNTGVRRIARGELDSRVQVKTRDEIGALAASFNEMAAELERTYDTLANKIVEIDRKAKQIALINEATSAINQALDLDETFRIIVGEVRKLVPYDRASIALLDDEGDTMTFQYVYPPQRKGLARGQKVSIYDSNIGLVMRTRTPLIRRDLELDQSGVEAPILLREGVLSFIIVPLVSQGKTIGSFNLGSGKKDFYSEEEKSLLLQIADTVAVAIEHSRLYTQVSRFAEELEEKVNERTRDLERAQQKLLQTEKFAAIGKLAANLAHEINNPLGIIKNYLHILKKQLAHLKIASHLSSEQYVKHLDIIKEEIERIARIVKGLLDFSRPSDEQNVPVSINQQIQELLQLMGQTLEEKNVIIRLDLQPDLSDVIASPDAVRQVFMNLFRNAEDAMDGGGELCVRTFEETTLENKALKKRVVACVEDTGTGIPREHLDKIFDPFFTTKRGEKDGTGLGLSVTLAILQSLGGTIEIESEVGKGTTAKVTIPVES
jgi:two-component system NtrC family sensor kinase